MAGPKTPGGSDMKDCNNNNNKTARGSRPWSTPSPRARDAVPVGLVSFFWNPLSMITGSRLLNVSHTAAVFSPSGTTECAPRCQAPQHWRIKCTRLRGKFVLTNPSQKDQTFENNNRRCTRFFRPRPFVCKYDWKSRAALTALA